MIKLIKKGKYKEISRHLSKRNLKHRFSIIVISCVIVMLAGVLAVGSMSLNKKNERYKQQETKLEEQISEEQERTEEIKELEEYVGTDKYVEDVAKEKLGLVYPNEILFEAE